MSESQLPPSAELRRLAGGYQVSQAIHVAATLGIADLLGDGTRSSDELAAATGAHPGSLYRLLRALASIGVFREEDGRRFALTPIGECLRSDAAEPLGGWAAFIGRPYYWHAWADLLHSVRTGENAFRHTHGVDVWTYRAGKPDESAIFDRAMTDLTRRANRALLEAYDFGRFETVVDVGGGRGALLAGLLAQYPSSRGVLFDQAHVVQLAESVLAEAGVADRCRLVSGSFFDAVPEGGNAYVLKSIVHDWEDDDAAAILRSCRRATPAEATLLLVEQVLRPGAESRDAAFSDLNMLVGPGGRERTLDEFAALLDRSGFVLRREVPTAAGQSVIEAVPAPA